MESNPPHSSDQHRLHTKSSRYKAYTVSIFLQSTIVRPGAFALLLRQHVTDISPSLTQNSSGRLQEPKDVGLSQRGKSERMPKADDWDLKTCFPRLLAAGLCMPYVSILIWWMPPSLELSDRWNDRHTGVSQLLYFEFGFFLLFEWVLCGSIRACSHMLFDPLE